MSDPSAPALTLAELMASYVELDRAKKSLAAEQEGLRREISTALTDEYRRTGCLPTHRLPGVGSAYLGGGGVQAVVHQPEAWGHWAAEHFPDRAALAIRVPMKRVSSDEFQHVLSVLSLLATSMDTEVDPDLLEVVAAAGTLDVEAGAVVTDDGELVGGVRVVDVAPHLTIRPVTVKP